MAQTDHDLRVDYVEFGATDIKGTRRFYERAGFRTHGAPWDDPEIGPHIAMWLDLVAVRRRPYP